MAIHFFEEDIKLKLNNKREVKQWLKSVVELEGYKLTELNYIFCSDSYLLEMNINYLNHNTLTDIITFDNSEKEGVIVGDIFISIERVEENAKKFNVEFNTELCRVMVHGVLHLLGYKDKQKKEKEKMREMENYYLERREA